MGQAQARGRDCERGVGQVARRFSLVLAEQVLGAANYLGTRKDRIVQNTVAGGRIGLFMGAKTLSDHWPERAHWIAAQ